ncbi:hypothetical protein [Microbacterium sp. T32]|uniref:hypothetical protein n=1 Tax=Microbacterium sp. T32 TaxID=1776083 RepID=UPI0007AB21E9|nr:hypothetical protein [Microbacterium sp. T32]KZE41437.1 hypothetical protein AVW09_02275 [Microbacterium sp. T32]
MPSSYSFTGFDPGALFAGVELVGDVLLDEAAGEMAVLGESLALRMQEELLRAVTRTGLARVAAGHGPHAGRYESGRMHDAISFDIEVDQEERIITLRWGWISDWADYFALQEWGTEHIEAVNSLGTTYSWGIAQLRGILSGMSTR